jgi:pectinesterase
MFMRILLCLLASCFSIHLSAQSFQYTVSKDNSSKYQRIQDVLNAIPSGNTKPVKIFVKAGVYNEVVIVDASKSNITLIGEDVNTTIINFNNHAC